MNTLQFSVQRKLARSLIAEHNCNKPEVLLHTIPNYIVRTRVPNHGQKVSYTAPEVIIDAFCERNPMHLVYSNFLCCVNAW
jgi:hypothetical protein